MGSFNPEEFERVIGGLRDTYGAVLPEPELKQMFTTQPDLFATALGRFRSEAHLIPNNRDSAHALRRLMLDTLQTVAQVESATKRRFDEYGHISPKRRREATMLERDSRSQQETIDEIPVRTKSSYLRSSTRIRALSASTDSFALSRASDHSFTLITRDQTPPPSSDDPFPASTQEKEALEASFSSFSDSFSQTTKNLWPRIPSWLNRQPLPVQWELMRICIHCKVDLSVIPANAFPSDWAKSSDMPDIWAAIKDADVFQCKSAPEFVSKETWAMAMNPSLALENKQTVNLKAEILDLDRTSSFKLLPLERDRLSHRLARRFGSDRFLEVSIIDPQGPKPPKAWRKPTPAQVLAWLRSRHHFLGRHWQPFFVGSRKQRKVTQKEDVYDAAHEYIHTVPIFFFATNGNNFLSRSLQPFSLPPLEEAHTLTRSSMTLRDLLDWAIGLHDPKSSSAQVPKLFSRLALSLSRTIPTVVLESSQIYHRDEDLRDDRFDDGQIMNDGIGRLSRALAKRVSRMLGLEDDDVPSAFQARIGPAKGVWIVDVDETYGRDHEWIETYPEQRKWICDGADVHHRTLEIKAWSREPRSGDLNKQLIPLLEEQSAGTATCEIRSVLSKLLQNTIADEVRPYYDAIGEPAKLLPLLYSPRQDTGRCVGAQFDRNNENLAALIKAGFDIKLRCVFTGVNKEVADKVDRIDKMKIQVPRSANMLMVADFTGTLGEGEVKISFSTKFRVDGFSDTCVEGVDVLVARNPAHLPSDIQRVRAVSGCPKLRQLQDVVIFSTKGKRPLADLLSGGDYDGDRAWVCWDQDIVQNFKNAPDPPPRTAHFDYVKDKYLGKFDLRVQDLSLYTGQNSNDLSAEFVHQAFSFIFGYEDLLGRCTKYKERYCHDTNSSSSQGAIAISLLLSDLVDQRKSGTIFTPSNWMRFLDDKIGPGALKPTEQVDVTYAKGHILDYLQFSVGKPEVDRWRQDIWKTMKDREPSPYDPDLTVIARNLESRRKTSATCRKLAKELEAALRRLKEHWDLRCTARVGSKGQKTSTEHSKEYQDMANNAYQEWLAIAPTDELRTSTTIHNLIRGDLSLVFSEWNLLKASYTHKLFYTSETFVWTVAGHHLRRIKADQVAQKEGRLADLFVPGIASVMKPNSKMIARGRSSVEEVEHTSSMEEIESYDEENATPDDF